MSPTPVLSAAPPPNFGQIPLPPGMTLEQLQSLQRSLVTIAITVAVAFGILIWDYCNLLPDEMDLYRRSNKELWHTPVTWAFVLLRYSGILAILPSLFFTSILNNYCQTAVVLSQIGVVLVVACAGVIFCYQVFSLWGGNTVIRVVVGFMYIAMLGCWCAVASQYRATNGVPTLLGSSCQMSAVVSWAPIGYSSSVVFDTAILLLAIPKLNTNHIIFSNVGTTISRNGLVYLLVTAITNIIVLVIQILGSRIGFIEPTAVPFSTLITATMGARVFVNLKLLNQKRERADQGLTFISATSGQDMGESTLAQILAPSTALRGQSPTKTYPINLTLTSMKRPDTPFASYDYDTPKDDKCFEVPHLTRETIVTVE